MPQLCCLLCIFLSLWGVEVGLVVSCEPELRPRVCMSVFVGSRASFDMCVLFASRYAVDVAWVNSVGTGSAITTGAAAPLETLPPVAPAQPPPSPVVVDIGSSFVTLQWGGAFVSGGARAVRWMVQTSSDGATYVMVLMHMHVYGYSCCVKPPSIRSCMCTPALCT